MVRPATRSSPAVTPTRSISAVRWRAESANSRAASLRPVGVIATRTRPLVLGVVRQLYQPGLGKFVDHPLHALPGQPQPFGDPRDGRGVVGDHAQHMPAGGPAANLSLVTRDPPACSYTSAVISRYAAT